MAKIVDFANWGRDHVQKVRDATDTFEAIRRAGPQDPRYGQAVEAVVVAYWRRPGGVAARLLLGTALRIAEEHAPSCIALVSAVDLKLGEVVAARLQIRDVVNARRAIDAGIALRL